ncbi:SRPBCC family protein [Geothrix fermentans]|jgi:uncharacterized protein YndB with AHSA1/START domain|uniref:SRPBCC family protein n=1 Tax=Geothrix fermentans TaxID=44676 RepID=UPI00040DA6B9|nr:SRPBCC domain-containing protein [Geothrix fermentans]
MNHTIPLPAVVVQREIDATAEELFDAWLDPESLAAWMRCSTCVDATARVDPRVGGEFEIVMTEPGRPHVHTGRYQVIERPRVLKFTWISEATKHTETLVTVEFLKKGRRTNVVVTHEQLPDQAAAIPHEMGWTHILELLAGHVRAA